MGRLVSPNNHPVVAARLAELRGEARREAVVTIHTIVARLDRAYDLAEGERNPSAMVQAAMGMAKVLGLIVDRKHHIMKPIEQWTEEECLALLGKDHTPAHGASARYGQAQDVDPKPWASLMPTTMISFRQVGRA